MHVGGRILLASVGAGAVLAALVAGASSDRPSASLPSVVRAWPAVVAVVVVAVSTVLVLRAASQLPRLGTPDDEGAGTRRRFVTAVALAVAIVLLRWLPAGDEREDSGAAGVGGTPEEGIGELPPLVAEVALAPSTLTVVVLVAAVVLVGVALARRSAAGASVAGEPRDLGEVVRSAEHEVRTGDDPRGAVLAAFARFEDGFAERGLPRGAAETQAAWVERLLVEHGADPAPARRLRQRFELARFATVPIDDDDRAAALADLAALVGERAGS